MSYVTLKENKMCIMDVIRNVVFDQRRGCKYIRLSVEGGEGCVGCSTALFIALLLVGFINKYC